MSVPEFAWNPAPAMLLPGSDEVHVWRATLDLPLAVLRLLSRRLLLMNEREPGNFTSRRTARTSSLPAGSSERS